MPSYNLSNLLILCIAFNAIQADINIDNTKTNDNHLTLNSNLTCEEFCATSLTTDQNFREFSIADWTRKREYRKHTMNEEYLKESSIIFGLTQLANEDYLNNDCFKHLKEIKRGILQKDVWAMKILDSSGTKKPGFLWGDNYWLGSQQGCEAVQTPILLTLSNKYERNMKSGLIETLAPFDMDYHVLYVEHNSPWQVEIKCMSERIIHIGLCLPKSCSIQEIHNLTQIYLNDGMLEESNIYDLEPKVLKIKNFQLDEHFYGKKSIKILGGFLLLTFLLILCATCLSDSLKEDHKTAVLLIGDDQNQNEIQMTQNIIYNELNLGQKIIKCFDINENIESLFTFKKESSNSIPIINGIRSIACFWIMLFHVIWFMYFTVENKIFLVSYGERLFYQYVSTAPLLVDIFFTISGFLVIYNFLKNDEKVNKIRDENLWENFKSYGNLVLHRYIRLAPLYLVVTGLVEVLTTYFENTSNFYIHERNDQTCSKFWWRNVLFVQNLFDYEEICLVWTWSLACEMQFYCLAVFLMFLYAKHPKLAKTIFLIGFIFSIIWSYVAGYQSGYQLSFDVIYNTGTEMYINPLIRIMPYLIGVAAGWYFAHTKGQFEISQRMEKFFWNFGITIFFLCIYSIVKRDMNFFWTISLLVIGRILFSGAICWMIFGSATGRSVWWSKILELQIFQHINKLSYAIYLLNPFVITVVYSLAKNSTHADPILLCVITTGFVVIVYLCSIIFSLSFEIPYCNISSLIMKNKLKLKKN